MRDKLIIVGGGPAGYTAAIYAARAGLAPRIILGPQPGGQLTTTTSVENYPGFPEGVQGPELMDAFKAQAVRFGALISEDIITKIDISARPFVLHGEASQYEAHAVIISTGASARKLGVTGEEEFWGKGVSTCATCDGYFFKDKRVVVVGGGDSAMEETLELSHLVKEIIILHRSPQFKASKIMQDRVGALKNVTVRFNTVIEKIQGEAFVKSVAVKNTESGQQEVIPIDGVFLAVGHIPNTNFLKDILTLDDIGYIVTDSATRTNIEGIFAAGDVVDRKYRQAVTSAGVGCVAALEVQSYLKEKNLH